MVLLLAFFILIAEFCSIFCGGVVYVDIGGIKKFYSKILLEFL